VRTTHTRHARNTTAAGLCRLCAAVTACVLLLAIAPARAQPADPREIQARADCSAGRVQAGVDALAQMFAESNDATYIYNQGRCYEQNGKFEEAVLRFREFLRKAKSLSAEEKAEVNGHINDCQAELNRRLASPPSPPSARIQPVPIEPVAPAKPEVAVLPKPGADVVTTLDHPSGGSGGAGLRTAGIVTGSLGTALVVAGVIFSIETRSIAKQVSSDDARNTYDRNKDDLGKLCSTLQWVGYGVGAAALATGGVLYYLGYRAAQTPASDSVSLLPVLLPGGSGAVLQGRF
jgi:tetratricopeptide (TPR) repeat protein